MGHLGWVKGSLGHTGASWGAQTGPHSGPPWGAVRGCRARARPPAPHSQLRCLSPSAGSKQLFSLMAAGFTKGPLSRARLCSQLCSGVPSVPEVPQGGTRGPRAQAGCSTPGGLASPGAAWGCLDHSTAAVAQSQCHPPPPAVLLFPEDPQTLPQNTSRQALRTRVGERRAAGVPVGKRAGPGSPFNNFQPLLLRGQVLAWPTNSCANEAHKPQASKVTVFLLKRETQLNNQKRAPDSGLL